MHVRPNDAATTATATATDPDDGDDGDDDDAISCQLTSAAGSRWRNKDAKIMSLRDLISQRELSELARSCSNLIDCSLISEQEPFEKPSRVAHLPTRGYSFACCLIFYFPPPSFAIHSSPQELHLVSALL